MATNMIATIHVDKDFAYAILQNILVTCEPDNVTKEDTLEGIRNVMDLLTHHPNGDVTLEPITTDKETEA